MTWKVVWHPPETVTAEIVSEDGLHMSDQPVFLDGYYTVEDKEAGKALLVRYEENRLHLAITDCAEQNKKDEHD